MKRSIFLAIFFALNSALALNIPSSMKGKIQGVKISDVKAHLGLLSEEIELATNYIENHKAELINNGEKVEDVFLTYFRALPFDNGNLVLPLTSFIKTKETGYQFTDYNLIITQEDFLLENLGSLNLADTYFQVKTSLADRKVVIIDERNQLKMIFPIGVGSFDEGVLNEGTSLLTPRFKAAFLDKDRAIKARKKPRYFAGKPFLRITTDENPSQGHTAIGFHAQPNLDPFIRAFDSHGCMRMQTDDLEFFYLLIAEGPHQRLPVMVNFYLEDQTEHPFPKKNKPYKTVTNIGSAENPGYTMDRDNLVQVTKIWDNTAPVQSLMDREDDDYHDIFDYAMAWREQERAERIRNNCKEKFGFKAEDFQVDRAAYVLDFENYRPRFSAADSAEDREEKMAKAKKKFEKDQKKKDRAYKKAVRSMQRKAKRAKKDSDKKMTKCLKQINRHNTLGDRIYRWWVH